MFLCFTETTARKPQPKMSDESDEDIQTGLAPMSQQVNNGYQYSTKQ